MPEKKARGVPSVTTLPSKKRAQRWAYRAQNSTSWLTISSDTLRESDVTGLRLVDTGGDICYTREVALARRDGEGATQRIDISVRVEENGDV